MYPSKFRFNSSTESPPNFSLGQAGDGQRHHGLGGHARGRHHANVAALVAGAGRLAGVEAHRFQRPAQRRDRLQVAAHHDVFAVGDAALDAAGVVVRAGKAGGLAGLSCAA